MINIGTVVASRSSAGSIHGGFCPERTRDSSAARSLPQVKESRKFTSKSHTVMCHGKPSFSRVLLDKHISTVAPSLFSLTQLPVGSAQRIEG